MKVEIYRASLGSAEKKKKKRSMCKSMYTVYKPCSRIHNPCPRIRRLCAIHARKHCSEAHFKLDIRQKLTPDPAASSYSVSLSVGSKRTASSPPSTRSKPRGGGVHIGTINEYFYGKIIFFFNSLHVMWPCDSKSIPDIITALDK